MFLTPDQISFLRDSIVQSISIKSLQDDLLDHACCLVEAKMNAGKTFEAAVREAANEIAPDGLEEIEEETNYLLNQNILRMKKVMYCIGLFTSMSFTMGLMMKLLHMPGGEELVNYGFLGFALMFLPMLTVHRFRTNLGMPGYEKLKILAGILSAVITGLAVFLKITMNLDASGLSLMTGASVFAFGFLPLHFYTLYKKSTGVTHAG